MSSAEVITGITECVTASSVFAGAATWIVRRVYLAIQGASSRTAHQSIQDSVLGISVTANDMTSRLVKLAGKAERDRMITAGIAAGVLTIWAWEQFRKRS